MVCTIFDRLTSWVERTEEIAALYSAMPPCYNYVLANMYCNGTEYIGTLRRVVLCPFVTPNFVKAFILMTRFALRFLSLQVLLLSIVSAASTSQKCTGSISLFRRTAFV